MDIVIGLILVNIIVFLLPNFISFGGNGFDNFTRFLSLGWKSNSDIRDGEYYRLLTSNFLHADVIHLFFNMFSLYQVGPAVAQIFGSTGFSVIYLSSGITGSLFSFFFNPLRPSVGASGAIFGLVGALLAYSLVTGNMGLLGNIILIIIINGAYGLQNGQIDNWGHLGGLVAGTVVAFLLILFAGSKGLIV